MEKKITIKDIARMCGVSITTVSRVINNKPEGVGEQTIARIREAIKETNYQPNSMARSMITKKSHTIGLVLPDVRNPFFSELARGVEDVSNKYSFGCFLCNTDGSVDKENEYIDLLRGRIADGILFTTQNNNEFNKAFFDFQRSAYPFCFIERYIDKMPDIPGVYFDNFAGARKMGDFLLDRGHRKIAFISGPLSTHNARQRRDGYIAALSDRGLDLDESLFVEGNYKYDGGYQAVTELLDRRNAEFTAVFAANDLMALGAYKNLEERGFGVPQDVSIAGFDNISFPPVLRPTITTIEIPAYELGVKSAEILFALIRGAAPTESRYLFSPVLRDKGSIRAI